MEFRRKKEKAFLVYFILYLVFVSFILITASVSNFKEDLDKRIVDNLCGKASSVESLINSSEILTQNYYQIKTSEKELDLRDMLIDIVSLMDYGSANISDDIKIDWIIDTIRNRQMISDNYIWITGRTGNYLGGLKYEYDFHTNNMVQKLISTFNDKKYIEDILSIRQNRFWVDLYNSRYEKYTHNMVVAYYDRNYDFIIYGTNLNGDYSNVKLAVDSEVDENIKNEMLSIADGGIVGYHNVRTSELYYYGEGTIEDITREYDLKEKESILEIIKDNKNSSFKYLIKKDDSYVKGIIYVKYDKENESYYFAGENASDIYDSSDKLQGIVNVVTISLIVICSILGFKTWEWLSSYYFKKKKKIRKHI